MNPSEQLKELADNVNLDLRLIENGFGTTISYVYKGFITNPSKPNLHGEGIFSISWSQFRNDKKFTAYLSIENQEKFLVSFVNITEMRNYLFIKGFVD